MKLFGINFAIGIATGLILEFEFGTNWSNYSWFVGDIFGAPLAIEGILAFFMETTFVAVMYFGWGKVSKGFHLTSTWLTVGGATISALDSDCKCLDAISSRYAFQSRHGSQRDGGLRRWPFSPVAINKFLHTVLSAWIVRAIFVISISSWYLIHKRHKDMALASIKVAAIFGLVASILLFGLATVPLIR